MFHFTLTKTEKWVGAAILLVILAVVCINLYVRMFSAPLIFSDSNEVPNARVALILGAAVYDSGELTPVLRDRAVTAVDLYKAGKVSKILVSGDNSRLDHNEVVPVSKFLIREGVREEDIFLDYAGFDTYDSMYRAREIFHVQSVIVITQDFHLPRAVYLARKMGLSAFGLSADRRGYWRRNQVREYFATVKAFGNVLLDSKPTYLGDAVPIGSKRGNVPTPEALPEAAGTSTGATATSTDPVQ